MSIFSKDQIGRAVRCKVVNSSDVNASIQIGWVKWTHAVVGSVVRSVEIPGAGKIKALWTVLEVDV